MIKKWFLNKWKWWTNDFDILVGSIKLVSPFVMIINFKVDGKPSYLILNGDYKEIRTKHIKRLEESMQHDETIISFDEFMEEINLLIPAKDIVLFHKKKWITKE